MWRLARRPWLKKTSSRAEAHWRAPLGRVVQPATHIGETTVSAVYLVALVGVGVSILWLALDAVISVSRKPRWETFAPRTLTLVQTPERRTQSMPFVGAERRNTTGDTGFDDGEERLVA
jgi:hypothetical protein